MRDDLPNLRHLRLALAIIEGDSLRSAAKKLNLTQPAASLAIAALENFYSRPLFERRANGLANTEAGQALARRILRCLFFLGKAISEVRNDKDDDGVSKTLSSITTAQLTAIAGMLQHDSFRAAAEFAGVRAATLQKAIGALEAVVEHPLTDRHRSGAQLNVAGRIFSFWAGRAVAELSAIAADIQDVDGHVTGTVSIGAIRVSAAQIVPHVIAEVTKIAPRAKFHVMQSNYQVLMEALRGGKIDYLCSTVRDTIPPDVEGEIIGHAQLRIFCSSSHPLARKERIDLKDLTECKWVGPSPQTGAVKAFRQMFEDRGTLPPDMTVETTSSDVTEQLVRTAFFLAIGNTMKHAATSSVGISILDVGELDLKRSMWLLYRRGWQPTTLQAKMRDAFIRFRRHEVAVAEDVSER